MGGKASKYLMSLLFWLQTSPPLASMHLASLLLSWPKIQMNLHSDQKVGFNIKHFLQLFIWTVVLFHC